MKAGAVITIPDHKHKTRRGSVTQPGLPGRWSIWSKADTAPGAHFAVPLDDRARATDPIACMPKETKDHS